MKVRIGKYKFDSKQAFEDRYNTTKDDYTMLVEFVGDTDGYCVDVMWFNLPTEADGTIDHPYGWKGKALEINKPKHRFIGFKYQKYKFGCEKITTNEQ